jgi:outer membrane protein assembly factor BamD (BamD/ComL family)
MELERNNRPAARQFFKKSIANATGQGSMRDQAFLKLGWLFLDEKKYPEAKNAYDSINAGNPAIADSLQILMDHKTALAKVVPQMQTIQRQDSLQRIAAMSEDDRNAYIKKMIRAYRKQQGLSEEEQQGSNGINFKSNAANADMFNDNANAEWYFYNQSLKAKGFNEFRSKYGNRPNVDNWQVQSMMNKQRASSVSGSANALNGSENAPAAVAAPVLTAEALLKNLPLTPEKLKKSQDSVETALYTLGKSLQDYIPDYRMAIQFYDSLEERFPTTRYYQEALFNTYYCYRKLGDSANALRVLALLKQKFPSGRYLALIEQPPAGPPDREARSNATHAYEKVYEDMIEGHFDEALAGKKKLDSTYGDKYWSAQLIYVEALYDMHTRRDSLAKANLNRVIARFSGTPMAAKAKNTLRVLMERERIEQYLSNLRISRHTDDSLVIDSLARTQPNKPVPDSALARKAQIKADSSQAAKIKADSLKPATPTVAFASPFSLSPDKPHAVALIMNKVDPVYVTESKNAFDRYNRENYYGKHFDIGLVSLSDSIKIVVIGGFENASAALTYLAKTSKVTGQEILPWLPAAKYSFIIIDDQNLSTLQTNKDIQAYKRFLSVYYPDRFPPAK